MPSPRRPYVLLLTLPALLMGCSAASAPSSATPPPAISANPTPVSTEATSGPTTSQSPATACPSGEYKATAFTAKGANGATGKGDVKDVDATFRNGSYTLEFDDDDPITLTVGGKSGRVRIDGEIRGSYTGDADDLTFKAGTTTGTATLSQGGKTGTVAMKQLATILGLQGKGSAVCSGDDLTVKTASLTWKMVRDIDD